MFHRAFYAKGFHMVDAKEAYRLREEICDAAPALTGSEKQIAWAFELRANAVLMAAVQLGDEITTGYKETERMNAAGEPIMLRVTEELTREHVEEIAAVSDSRWWINEGRWISGEPGKLLASIRGNSFFDLQ